MSASGTPRIRAATPADIPRLAPIEEAADLIFADAGHPEFHGAISDGEAAQAIDEGRITVIDIDGVVLGWVHLGRLDGELCVEQISVDPDQHGRGLGTRLMGHVQAQAREANEASITLDTQSDVPWNQPWYEQLGFVVVPEDEWSDAMVAVAERQTAAGFDWGTRVHMRWQS